MGVAGGDFREGIRTGWFLWVVEPHGCQEGDGGGEGEGDFPGLPDGCGEWDGGEGFSGIGEAVEGGVDPGEAVPGEAGFVGVAEVLVEFGALGGVEPVVEGGGDEGFEG